MGLNEEQVAKFQYYNTLSATERLFKRIFGATESLYVMDTTVFESSLKYDAPAYDEIAKAKRHNDVFPIDWEKAYNRDLGLVSN